MKTTISIDEEINQYLPQLSTEQKKAVLGVVKTFAADESERWSEEEYDAEMIRRIEEMESGKVKGLTLDEMETAVRASYKMRSKKKQ